MIGLDGADPDLVREYAAEGCLPNMQRIIQEGVWGELRSTVPPVTAPAWVSLMTGKNPGRHGVYNFRNLDLESYGGMGPKAYIASSASFRGQSIFELVSAHGGRVASINMPATYPPFPVNGVLISGLPLLPDMRKAYTWPSELGDRIGAWSMDNETLDRLSEPHRLEAVDFWTRRHTEVSEELLRDEDWDFFAVVLRLTDAVPHYFWKYTDPSYPGYAEDSRYRHIIRDTYAEADRAVGRLLEAAGSDALGLVVSDHGTGAHHNRCVNLNKWLLDQGLLSKRSDKAPGNGMAVSLQRLRDRVPRNMRSRIRDMLPEKARDGVFRALNNVNQIDWPNTKAYRVPIFPLVDGIELNVIGRQPQGSVAPGEEYEAVRDRIIEGLRELRDPATGACMVEEVHRREEVYDGPHVEEAPDIIVIYHFPFTGGLGLDRLISDYDESINHWSGAHRMNGIVMATGPDVERGVALTGSEIIDVTPTILFALDLPLPADVDGKVLLDVFKPNMRSREIKKSSTEGEYGLAMSLTADEEEKIAAQLKGLGYL
jgi:predicted AlkP superfamily phosphohydrolase/phosphomutase